eukprot:7607298-Pyramimonas_sp.AAC.1
MSGEAPERAAESSAAPRRRPGASVGRGLACAPGPSSQALPQSRGAKRRRGVIVARRNCRPLLRFACRCCLPLPSRHSTRSPCPPLK